MAAAMVAEADAPHMKTEPLRSLPQELIDLRKEFSDPGSDSDPSEGGSHTKRDSSTYWMEEIEHVGRVPFGGAASDGYVVFRNVKDYGAKVSTKAALTPYFHIHVFHPGRWAHRRYGSDLESYQGPRAMRRKVWFINHQASHSVLPIRDIPHQLLNYCILQHADDWKCMCDSLPDLCSPSNISNN